MTTTTVQEAGRHDAKTVSPRKMWIFQANPKLNRVEDALRDVDRLTWQVKNHADEIRAGDGVLLWLSGPEAGVIASATVDTDPAAIPEAPAWAPYLPPGEDLEEPSPRVWLRIERRLPQRLARDSLRTVPELRELSILRFAQATNFPVTASEGAVLRELCRRVETDHERGLELYISYSRDDVKGRLAPRAAVAEGAWSTQRIVEMAQDSEVGFVLFLTLGDGEPGQPAEELREDGTLVFRGRAEVSSDSPRIERLLSAADREVLAFVRRDGGSPYTYVGPARVVRHHDGAGRGLAIEWRLLHGAPPRDIMKGLVSAKGGSSVARTDERERAESTLRKLLLDVDQRQAVLSALGESMRVAHAQGESAWSVSRRGTRAIRMNAGATQAFVIRDNEVQVNVDRPTLEASDAFPLVAEYVDGGGSRREDYRMVPSTAAVFVPAARFGEVFPHLRVAHHRFLELAANMRCPHLRAHSPEVVELVSEASGEALPNPVMPEESAKLAGGRYWKVSPGENAKIWNEWSAGGHASIGWHELGDLRGISRTEFEARMRACMAEHPTWTKERLEQVWKFSRIQPGDHIVANQGTSRILGVGLVVGSYEYDDNVPHYKHRLPVEWVDTTTRQVDRPGWKRTLIRLKDEEIPELLAGQAPEGHSAPDADANEDAEAIDFATLLSDLEDQHLHFAPELVANYLLALQTKRFVILTGISGTGKTKLAIEVAKTFQKRTVRTVPDVAATAGAEQIEVHPYMVKHGRIVVPADVAAQYLAVFEPRPGNRWVAVELPDGTQVDCAGNVRPNTNLLQVVFHSNGKAWLTGRRVGEKFLVDFLEDEARPRIRIRSPEAGELSIATPRTYEVIPVRPDWTDGTALLGFYNPLTAQYARTPFLRLVLRARDEEQHAQEEGGDAEPYFAVLDEMNLARVEHYFSDVLSAMESGEEIPLHDDVRIEEGEDDDTGRVPRRLKLPKNLFLIGTVNVDETTYMFSPKVLDRAFTMELNDVDLVGYAIEVDGDEEGAGDGQGGLTLDSFEGTLRFARAPTSADWRSLTSIGAGRLQPSLIELNAILAKWNRHFGYRVANEMARFITLAVEQCTDRDAAAASALDLVVLQKVLPKLHGTQQELDELLGELLSFAKGSATDESVGTAPRLPRSTSKLVRMRTRLRAQGFTSFIE